MRTGYVSSDLRIGRMDFSRYGSLLVATLLIFVYLDKFMTLSANIIDEIGISALSPQGLQINTSYYPLETTFLIVASFFLLLFVMTSNEHRALISSPTEWRGYPTIIVGLAGFLLLFFLINTFEIRPRSQIWMFLFGLLTSCAILVFDECEQAIDMILRTVKSPRDAPIILKESWRGVIKTFSIVALYLSTLLVPLFLPGFSAMFYELISRAVLVVSVLTITIGVYSIWDLSLERVKPSVQDRKFSSTVLLFAAPFLLYLILRMMYLINTDQNWELSYEFMEDIGGFPVHNWPWQINPTQDSRWTFYRAGILNSVRATLVSIVLCTLLGIFIGVTRLSNNRLAAGLATGYVEFFRNIPLAILLFFMAVQLREALPDFGDEFFLFNLFYISKEGHWVPSPELVNTAIALAILAGTKAFTWYQDRDGVDDSQEGVIRRMSIWALSLLVCAAIFFSGDFSIPELIKPFETSTGSWYIVEGTGFKITGPFVALVLSLTLFTASIVAEIVRGSIQSLPRGQVEAAISLGLNPFQRLRLVILPQALRSMVPLLNSQYMNVWKNSSLAIIVAYSDIFYITLVMMNNVGKLIPLFMLLLIIYQSGSLLISALMNAYNARVTRVKI